MQVRKLRATSSGGTGSGTGGNAPSYQQRKSGIFFASAGFVEDFDYNYKCESTQVTNSRYLRNSINCISYSSGYSAAAYFSKFINLNKFSCFFHMGEIYFVEGYIKFFVIKIGDKYLTIDKASGQFDLKIKNSLSDSGTIIESKKVAYIGENVTFEFYFDLPSRQIIFYKNSVELVSFSFAGIELSSDKAEQVFLYPITGVNYISEIVFSTERIGDICIKPMLASALGDSDDFNDSSKTIIGKYCKNSTALTAAAEGSTELYKYAVPTLPAGAIIDSVVFGSSVKGDNMTTLCNLLKIAGTEYQGNTTIPNAESITPLVNLYANNPATGEPWTTADLTDLQAGIKILGVEE